MHNRIKLLADGLEALGKLGKEVGHPLSSDMLTAARHLYEAAKAMEGIDKGVEESIEKMKKEKDRRDSEREEDRQKNVSSGCRECSEFETCTKKGVKGKILETLKKGGNIEDNILEMAKEMGAKVEVIKF